MLILAVYVTFLGSCAAPMSPFHSPVGVLQELTSYCEHLEKRRRHFASSPSVRTVAST
ncbi:hypothetical protein Sden_2257 [Shewanella denitrificans OS217]|uniref:Uncharacterized protein n=1 Tax=Shewanella denitrificans (strain OS217 / ATCC BAA-1090 / DSM 15013) TaxID=318161 RepID=Q12LY9_SHEDO|nr:hypothetical protein Sden_2257 [Shewanella denitrificans OS217]